MVQGIGNRVRGRALAARTLSQAGVRQGFRVTSPPMARTCLACCYLAHNIRPAQLVPFVPFAPPSEIGPGTAGSRCQLRPPALAQSLATCLGFVAPSVKTYQAILEDDWLHGDSRNEGALLEFQEVPPVGGGALQGTARELRV